MIVRNIAGMARRINNQLVRQYRTVEVPEDYVLDEYLEVVSKSTPKEKEPIKEEKIDYDLNGDGVFDDKDKSIAGKVLRTKTKKNNKR